MQAAFLLMQQFENQLSFEEDNIDGNTTSNGDGDKEFNEKIGNLLLYVMNFFY